MEKVEHVARAMAQADGRDPDQPLTGYRRIVAETIPVTYDAKLPAWSYYVPLAKLFIAASQVLSSE